MGNSFDQSREFVPAGLTDVQAAYSFPRRPHYVRSEIEHRPPKSHAAPQEQSSSALSPEQARQIENYLKQLGDRIAHTRGEEVSGVAPVTSHPGYGLAR